MIHPALDWLLGLERLGMKFGLENMRTLVAELGHPERQFRSVHIAGTNGKGSVTAMLEAALHHAGHRSARYTSPHLERLEERFVLEGEEVSTPALVQAVEEVRHVVERVSAAAGEPFHPTFFECTTAAAFVAFRNARTDIAVLETGLGGRLDATNIIVPIATAITSIDFDHQALLGDTLAEIAREKAGIIKPEVPVVLGPLPAEAEREILPIAHSLRAPVVRGRQLPDVTPALPGRHQHDNIAVTAALADVISSRGFTVPEAALRFGVEHVKWPARLERLASGSHELLLDAAHNPAGTRALADYLRDIAWTDAALVFGAMADKDVGGMLGQLLDVVASTVCTTAQSPRAAEAETIAAEARRLRPAAAIHIEPDPERAVALARTVSPRVVIAGSMFLVGPLRGILR